MLAIYRELEDRPSEADALGAIGNTERDLHRYGDALSSYQGALAIHREVKSRSAEATDLGNIGLVQQDLGRYDDAIRSYQQSLAIAREVKDRLLEADDLGNTGIVDTLLGRYDDALSLEEQALSIDREIHDRLDEANFLGNIGIAEALLGRYDDALAMQGQALVIDRALHNRRGEANVLTTIGNVDYLLDRYDDALASYGQALTIARAIGNRLGEANALSNIGNAQWSLARYDAALTSHRQSLAINRELGNRLGEAVDLGDIGIVEENLGHYDEALASARQAEDMERRLLDLEGLWRTLRTAANAESHLKRREAALADYDAALVQIESLRAGLAASERTGFFSNKLAVYDEYIAYLLELEAAFPGNGYGRKALAIFERKNARAVLEQIGQSAAQHFRGVPPAVVAEEGAVAAAADRAQAALSTLLSASAASQTALASAEQDLSDAKARVATVEASIKTQYPAYYELRHPQPLTVECPQTPCTTIAGFQQAVLRPGELVLVYDVLPARSVLWLIDRDRVQLVPLAGSAEIDAAVARLGAHVAGMLELLHSTSATRLERRAAADLPEFATDSYALYRMLLPDGAADAVANAKSAIVVPSGSLYRLAFETLVTRDPASGSQPHYLIEDVPVSYVPSASLLAVVRASYAQPNGGRSPLLAFANPTFGPAAPARARGLSDYAGLQLAAARSAFRGDAGAATSVAGAVFPALPGTQTEADAVRAALGASTASVIVGDAATRRRVFALNDAGRLQKYQYLLFATHAVLPSEIKGLTQPAIVLAHPERGDGLLTMADVFGLALDADFVTLSACNTGVATSDAGGDGISGLTRAFLYAGTPAISVTLWDVDDAAAPQLTPRFFAGMYAGKLGAAEALRRAKLALLASPQARFRHPYAWGPSVIFGDGTR